MITFLGDVALLGSDMKCTYKIDSPYIFNLEYVTGNQKHTPCIGKINIYSEHSNFEKVFGKNPIAVNVANNHILDFGKEGFLESINVINEKNIPTIGDKIFFLNGNTCIISYTLFNGKTKDCNYVEFSKEQYLNDYATAKESGASSVIVLMHWGIENHSGINSQQKELGHWLIDNGAEIVIGSHPHCIQPIELYKDHYIVYSLGNCFFPSFNLDSHYNSDGISTRKYRFRWQRWNRKSLAVIYDEDNNKISRIDELYYTDKCLKLHKSGVSISKYTKQRNTKLDNIIYTMRKYLLFFISNAFVDGKIFDLNALYAERKKNG